jgi:hypothetical protein
MIPSKEIQDGMPQGNSEGDFDRRKLRAHNSTNLFPFKMYYSITCIYRAWVNLIVPEVMGYCKQVIDPAKICSGPLSAWNLHLKLNWKGFPTIICFSS